MTRQMTRRRFTKYAGMAAAALPNIITSKALGSADGTPPASERIAMGAVGCGGQGASNITQITRDKRVQLVAACDVKRSALEQCMKKSKDIRGYVDYREMIARPDIDLVMCATPDHWHAQITIDAMKSGKDIYCEKPLSLTIAEGRKMVDAARMYGRIFSCGSQRVIGDYGRLASAARSGLYGRIIRAHASPGGPPRMCYLPAQGNPEQDGIDWDLWLGPAPWAPYHPFRHGRSYGLSGRGFRSWYDYSGGMMTDWGGHKFGGAMHGMGVDDTGPVKIIHPGSEGREHLTHVFKNGMELVVGGGQKFVCEQGEAKPFPGMPMPPPGLRWYEGDAQSPYKDIVNCIVERRRPFRDVEYAHRVATVCHLGNICLLLKRDLEWDPDGEVFINDEEANRLLDRPRRGPWQI
jgi:hypothetical protein